MTIRKNKNGAQLTVQLAGRLDTTTSPQLESELRVLDGVSELFLDFSSLEYISSAGLRVLLAAQKQMNSQRGVMKVLHVNESIMEVFDITGFADILTIE